MELMRLSWQRFLVTPGHLGTKQSGTQSPDSAAFRKNCLTSPSFNVRVWQFRVFVVLLFHVFMGDLGFFAWVALHPALFVLRSLRRIYIVPVSRAFFAEVRFNCLHSVERLTFGILITWVPGTTAACSTGRCVRAFVPRFPAARPTAQQCWTPSEWP